MRWILEQRDGFGRRFLWLWHVQPSGQVKTKASPPVAAVAEPPALSAPPEERKSKEAEQQQKTLRCTKARELCGSFNRKRLTLHSEFSERLRIDEAVKASKELADAKFEFEVGPLILWCFPWLPADPGNWQTARWSAFQQEGCETQIG